MKEDDSLTLIQDNIIEIQKNHNNNSPVGSIFNVHSFAPWKTPTQFVSLFIALLEYPNLISTGVWSEKRASDFNAFWALTENDNKKMEIENNRFFIYKV